MSSKVKCLNCKSILKSTHRHDFVACKCYHESETLCERFEGILQGYLDEGLDLSLHTASCAFMAVIHKGVAVDGGDDYLRISGSSNNYEVIKDDNGNSTNSNA